MVIGQLSSTFKKVRKILFWDDRIIWKCIADDSTNKTRIKQRNWLSIMINHKLEKSIARKWRRVKNKADEYLVVSYLIFMEVYSTLELYTLFEKSIAEGIDTRRGMEGNKKQGWKRLQSRFDVVVIIQGCRGILNVWRSYTSIRFFLFFFFHPWIGWPRLQWHGTKYASTRTLSTRQKHEPIYNASISQPENSKE